MNQILVTEKIYITPEIKRKKRLYKLEFFLSIFLVCILSSYYIYAEYNRNESEEVSQQILAEVKIDDTIKQASSEDDVLIIVLDEEQANEHPRNIAIIYDGKKFTYKQLSNRVNDFAKFSE